MRLEARCTPAQHSEERGTPLSPPIRNKHAQGISSTLIQQETIARPTFADGHVNKITHSRIVWWQNSISQATCAVYKSMPIYLRVSIPSLLADTKLPTHINTNLPINTFPYEATQAFVYQPSHACQYQAAYPFPCQRYLSNYTPSYTVRAFLTACTARVASTVLSPT